MGFLDNHLHKTPTLTRGNTRYTPVFLSLLFVLTKHKKFYFSHKGISLLVKGNFHVYLHACTAGLHTETKQNWSDINLTSGCLLD